MIMIGGYYDNDAVQSTAVVEPVVQFVSTAVVEPVVQFVAIYE